MTLDNLEDARRILRLAQRARRACVVGGGITAIELAEGLAAHGVETHYLMRGDRYWASVLDPHESTLVEERLAEDGIRIHRGVELAGVIGRNGIGSPRSRPGTARASSATSGGGGRHAAAPRARAQMRPGDRPRHLDRRHASRRATRDIFAAGDAAEVLDPATGKRGDRQPVVGRHRAGPRRRGEHERRSGQPYRRRRRST